MKKKTLQELRPGQLYKDDIGNYCIALRNAMTDSEIPLALWLCYPDGQVRRDWHVAVFSEGADFVEVFDDAEEEANWWAVHGRGLAS